MYNEQKPVNKFKIYIFVVCIKVGWLYWAIRRYNIISVITLFLKQEKTQSLYCFNVFFFNNIVILGAGDIQSLQT